MTIVPVRVDCRHTAWVWAILAACLPPTACVVSPQRNPESITAAPRWVTPSNAPLENRVPEMPSRVISFDTTEATLMNVDVAPDGTALTFDLLGDLYWLPINGGEAVPLTSGRAWDQAPRFSPDGKSIYFVSDRVDAKNIWHLNLGDRSLAQVTASESNIRGTPNWSQDGSRLLVGRSDPAGNNVETILQSVDPKNGNMTPVDFPSEPWFDMIAYEFRRQAVQQFSGVQTVDGQIYFAEHQFKENLHRMAVGLYEFDLNTQTRTVMTPSAAPYDEFKPQLSHDGNLLAYFRQYHDRRTEIRLLNRSTWQDRALIALTGADDASYGASEDSRPNYAFTRDDRYLIFWHDGKIRRVTLADGSMDTIPFHLNVVREVWERVQAAEHAIAETGEAKVIRWPSVSRDGHKMAFMAVGYVWIMDMETGQMRRLTDSSDFEYMPALSPDGRFIAYISFVESEDEYWPGRLMVADVDGGTPQLLLTAPNETFILPRWSEDSQKIAIIREVQNSDGIEATFGWTQAFSGEFHDLAPAPASDEWLTLPIFARFIGFDAAGHNLLFSFQKSGVETILLAASLHGGAPRTLATGTAEVGGITPSPDLKRLALTRRDGTVWIVPFRADADSTKVSTLASDARQVNEVGGYYVGWNSTDRITFGFGQNVFRSDLNRHTTESLNIKVPFPMQKSPSPIAFTGARLITMSSDKGAGPVIERGTVVLDGRRISAVGSTSAVVIPADAIVIDAAGKTIMPGLLDTHYHRIGGSGLIGLSALKLPNPKFSDRTAIVYGTTTAWEPGGPHGDGVSATVDLQLAGRILGPRWFHTANGGISVLHEPLNTYADARAAVERRQKLGAVVLKEYNTPTRVQRQWLSAAAREKELGIISHLESFEGMLTGVVDGFTGGDHAYIPIPFFKDVHELLRQTRYIWTPNVVITSGTVGTAQDKINYYCYAVLEWKHRSNRAIEERSTICNPDQKHITVPYDIHRVGRVAKQAASAARNGIHIGVSAHSMPGSNLHREMWHLWKGGMPIADVLRAATIGNAEKLGLQGEIGSLEPGKMADLLVLSENPLDDILNIRSLVFTVQGGVVYDSATAQVANFLNIHE